MDLELFRRLRQEENLAYSHLVRCFVAHGQLSKQKLRLLEDLREILAISDERHSAEEAAAQSDTTLQKIADHKISQNRSYFVDTVIEKKSLEDLSAKMAQLQVEITQLKELLANAPTDQDRQKIKQELDHRLELVNGIIVTLTAAEDQEGEPEAEECDTEMPALPPHAVPDFSNFSDMASTMPEPVDATGGLGCDLDDGEPDEADLAIDIATM
eukprot:TRINITY_DN43790_c0_g1_i1.p1 TRINITY_DN43790_c0_g1~~TRINITY_DN43790_c0_g1_i1.p1  ORF type:complete len:213 (+),score=45.31 TRINITY_DN43790_c0_g1_i1:53-691(+)